jgi:hypothetical protein
MMRCAMKRKERRPKIIMCHSGHENDIGYTENISEFLAAAQVDYDCRILSNPFTLPELLAAQEHFQISLLGFNSQIDHSWVEDQPLVHVAARNGIPVMQWIMDHPSGHWPEFNYSNPLTSRFLFHSRYSENYFEQFCCPGATTAVAGSVGPNWRSRGSAGGAQAFSRRPINCLIALGLARLGVSIEETQAQIEALGPLLSGVLREAISSACFELDQPLETRLIEVIEEKAISVDQTTFNWCFRLLNDSVQYFRRAQIIRTASRFGVHIQSDRTAMPLIQAGPASFRQDVGTPETLENMVHCRAVLSVSPVNDSIHDRTCNALNAGCVPILEDNRAHRGLFVHGENALLFRYQDDSLRQCLSIAFGDPDQLHPMAVRARELRDQQRFRFGQFRNIVDLARISTEPIPFTAAPHSG